MKRVIGLLLAISLVSLCLTGCMPSEKKIRNAIDSIEEIENAKMEMTMGIPVWGQVIDAKSKMECDGNKQHWKTTIVSTGEVIEECYIDGDYKYTRTEDGWEKEDLNSESSDNSSESNETTFDAWIIDSIKKADDEIIVRGSVDVGGLDDDESFPATLEMDYKLKMDKKCNVISIELKATDVSSQISNLTLKVYDIGEASVDFDEVEF